MQIFFFSLIPCNSVTPFSSRTYPEDISHCSGCCGINDAGTLGCSSGIPRSRGLGELSVCACVFMLKASFKARNYQCWRLGEERNPSISAPSRQQMSSWGWSLLSTGLANEKRAVQARAETSQLGLAAGLVPMSGADTPT